MTDTRNPSTFFANPNDHQMLFRFLDDPQGGECLAQYLMSSPYKDDWLSVLQRHIAEGAALMSSIEESMSAIFNYPSMAATREAILLHASGTIARRTIELNDIIRLYCTDLYEQNRSHPSFVAYTLDATIQQHLQLCARLDNLVESQRQSAQRYVQLMRQIANARITVSMVHEAAQRAITPSPAGPGQTQRT